MAAKQSFIIKVPLYKTEVRVCLTKEEWRKYSGEETGTEAGCCTNELAPAVGLFQTTPSIIAHEMLHACVAILNGRGLNLTPNSEEAYTYLLEYLVEQTHKRLEKINGDDSGGASLNSNTSGQGISSV
jgi:hypothetical protein